MPLIFNSVQNFVEAIGRRTVRDKRNTLDRITCIFTGDSAGALGFLPANGTPHPQFPLMYCERAQILTIASLMAEVEVSYIGKLEGSPTGVYATAPDISTSQHWGQSSWQTYDHTAVYGGPSGETFDPVIVTPAALPTFNEDGTLHTPGTDAVYGPSPFNTTSGPATIVYVGYSWTSRYVSKTVTFKYLTNTRPDNDSSGRFASEADPYLGIINRKDWRTAASTSTDGFGVLISSLVFENDLTDLSVNDLDNGWLEISETYQSVGYVKTDILPPPRVTVGD